MIEDAPLVDVSTVDFTLLDHDDVAVSAALQRILATLDEPDGVLSAFNSFIGADPA